MKHILTYEELVLENLNLNESINIRSAFDFIKKLSGNAKRNAIKYLLISLVSIYTISEIKDMVKSEKLGTETEMVVNDELEKLEKDDYKKGYQFILSQQGWDDIREEENLRLVGYKLDDGRITIGYGHAEPIRTSKYKVGQKISKEHAEKLLKHDLKIAADGVRRIFKEWENKGIKVKINQNQFDAMVSMAYNMGISALRQTEFIQKLKRNKFNEAAELIKVTNLKDNLKGVENRRYREYKKFIS